MDRFRTAPRGADAPQRIRFIRLIPKHDHASLVWHIVPAKPDQETTACGLSIAWQPRANLVPRPFGDICANCRRMWHINDRKK